MVIIVHLADLQDKDIVNIKDGIKVGKIIDVKININGQIETIIIQKNKLSFIPNNIIEVNWKQIKKIGKDVILIDLNI